MSIAATTLVLAAIFVSHLSSAQEVRLEITPSTSDEGFFVGGEFSRTCRLTGNIQGSEIRIEWLRDGSTVLAGNGSELSLRLPSVGLSDAGEYTCTARVSSAGAEPVVLGPMSAGTLRVADPSPINVSGTQYLLIGSNVTLTCSYNDSSVFAFPSVTTEDLVEVKDGRLTNVTLDDGGTYICDVFLPNLQASTAIPIIVHVIVPLELISHPPPHTTIEGNPPKSLTVRFTGHVEQNIRITWYKNGNPLQSSYPVVTRYDSNELTGSTSLDFPAIRRQHSGVYRVVLENMLGAEALSRDLVYREISFQVDVVSPPSMPDNFRVEVGSVTSVFARIRWTNTNRTQDSGAERLALLLTYSNMSLVQEVLLPGYATQVALDLIPGTEYVVRLRAENHDGMVITNPVSFTTLAGNPKINEVSVRQTGAEANFQVSASLAYTGGAAISFFGISYRQSTTGEFIRIENVQATSNSDPLVWMGTFTITDPDFNPVTNIDNLQFTVFVTNQFNYRSSESVIQATQSVSPTTSPDDAGGSGGSGASNGGSLPIWVFIAIGVSATVVVLILVAVCVCIVAVCRCRKSHKNDKVYKVNSREESSKETVQDPESGKQQHNGLPSTLPNTVVNNLSHSGHQPHDMNRINAIHHNGLAPSIKTNSSSPTPQPDEQLLKKQINYAHHQKYPSDVSSIIKRGPTPSTTASSSPAPAAMKAAYEQQLQSESGRGSSISSSMHNMEQFTQTQHQFQRQQPGNGEVENQQSSQTESDYLQMPNDIEHQQHSHHSLYPPPLHHQHQFSDNHLSPNNSQQGSIPLFRVGLSNSNISMPAYNGSMQGSEQNLINGSSHSVLFPQYPTPYHNSAVPYTAGYGLSAVGSSTAIGGKAESLCSYSTVGVDSVFEGGSLHPSVCNSQLQTTV